MDIQAEVSIPSNQEPEAVPVPDFDPYAEFMFLIEPQPDPPHAMPDVNAQGAENEFDIDLENIPPADFMLPVDDGDVQYPPVEACAQFDHADLIAFEKFVDDYIHSPCFT